MSLPSKYLQMVSTVTAEGELRMELVEKDMPELPSAKRSRFVEAYGLSGYDAGVLSASKETADFFEACVHAADGAAKSCANWVNGDFHDVFAAVFPVVDQLAVK